jgi:monofunctional biosynthetic peptidoglycan transglycosylase
MTMANATEVDFSSPDEPNRWIAVMDGVMGGRSAGGMSFHDGYAVFSGVLSLENNGGFASVRRMWSPNSENNDRIVIRVRGDGRQYQLRLRQNRRFNGVAYSTSFTTKAGEWRDYEFTAADFRAVYFGREVRNAAPLEFDRVRQFGFLLADKSPGEFSLSIGGLSMLSSNNSTNEAE